MKQVWILNHYAQEPGGAGGTRHFHLAESLVSHGWQATVIAASVELNSGRQRLNETESARYEVLSGVPFLWVRTPEYAGNGGGRIKNMLAYFWRAVLPKTTKNLSRPQAIIGSSVHPFAAVAGAILARRYKVPFVFEVRDLWPQTLVDMGRLNEKSLVTFALRRLETWLYRCATRIVVLLPQAWQYIVPLGIPRDRIVWIPNGVDLDLFPKPTPMIERPDGGFTLMYFGAHGQANGLDNVLKAMAIIQNQACHKRITLRLIGDGPLKASLIDQSRQLGLSNVSFEDPVPKRSIPALAAQADAFVFNLIDAPVFRFGISSNKLFDFMASARPIVFSCDSTNNPVNDAQAGLTVSPGKPSELAEAIMEISTTPLVARMKMGQSARAYVESNHTFGELAKRLGDTLNLAVQEHK